MVFVSAGSVTIVVIASGCLAFKDVSLSVGGGLLCMMDMMAMKVLLHISQASLIADVVRSI